MQVAPPTPVPHESTNPSIGGLILFPIVVFVLLYAVSYPIITATALATTALLFLTIRKIGPHIASRLQNKTRTLNIPAFGTIEYRITPE